MVRVGPLRSSSDNRLQVVEPFELSVGPDHDLFAVLLDASRLRRWHSTSSVFTTSGTLKEAPWSRFRSTMT